jgi:hypothetical protein
MKERDTSYQTWITKTKSKRYVAICKEPNCNWSYMASHPNRIVVSMALRHHLRSVHNHPV